jgi:hypothetical protein
MYSQSSCDLQRHPTAMQREGSWELVYPGAPLSNWPRGGYKLGNCIQLDADTKRLNTSKSAAMYPSALWCTLFEPITTDITRIEVDYWL